MTILVARARTALILRDVSRSRTSAMYASVPRWLRRLHEERKDLRYQALPDTEPEKQKNPTSDPRINDIGRAIEDDFATIRDNYGGH